ncbi:MAG: PLP-dependent aminotransferase family protein [Bacteroidota bacterium]
MLPFNSIIHIDKSDKLPVYLQISQQLTDLILSGRLLPGTKLPGSRKMAGLLEVNRNTIIAVYEELDMQGWLDTRNSSGSYVKEKLPVVAETYIKVTESAMVDDLVEVHKTYPLNFDDGQPDVRFTPLLSLTREMSALVKTDYFHRNLNYSEELRGDIKLRQQLSIYLRQTRGIDTNSDGILITSGTVNAFHLYLHHVLSKNDAVIVGTPGYTTFNKILDTINVKTIEIAVDEDGLQVDQIEKVCQQRDIAMVYAIPHHHHPTTVKLSAERRMKLMQLSEKYNFKIVEDDYDYDFHYDSSPVLPLASYKQHDNVVYVGSFSKLLMPSIRIGFLVASPTLVLALSRRRRYVDRCGNPLIERAMANLMESGEINRSLKKAIKNYRVRRDLLADLLTEELSDFIDFQKPEGGMAIWVQFREDVDIRQTLNYCRDRGLDISDPDFYNTTGNHQLRLGFAMMNEQEIKEGFSILKDSILSQFQ